MLLSIQALVLCEQPYYNEAGYEKQLGTSEGAHHARRYNEGALLLSLWTFAEVPTSGLGLVAVVAHALERASLHRLPGHARGECCTVIEIRPREPGAPVTFRFPDKDVRTLFDLSLIHI